MLGTVRSRRHAAPPIAPPVQPLASTCGTLSAAAALLLAAALTALVPAAPAAAQITLTPVPDENQAQNLAPDTEPDPAPEPAPEARPAPGPGGFAREDASEETSACYAFSENRRLEGLPELPVIKARFAQGLTEDDVALTFVGHATFLIESAAGVAIATDFAGYAGPNVIPDVVTMNIAHSSHYTNNPDPRIDHVLRGWPTPEGPAAIDARIGDVRIRNVTTDVIRDFDVRFGNANSIFIFEVADLCIGHLGHIHHQPSPEQLGAIGFLDVVLAPVDGGYTMAVSEMVKTLENVRARMIVPMHYFGSASLARFTNQISASFPVTRAQGRTMVLRRDTMPTTPTVVIMPPLSAPERFFP